MSPAPGLRMRQLRQATADVQVITLRCRHDGCDYVFDGLCGEGRRAIAEHRSAEHPLPVLPARAAKRSRAYRARAQAARAGEDG